MTRGRIRRSQLIAPFGVGAITVVPDGTSVITAGLDHWYERIGGSAGPIDRVEFQVEEWRLQQLLGVRHFRLPPDNRTSHYGAADQPNLELSVPGLRFPRWHFCPRSSCRTLCLLPLSFGELRRCDVCTTSSNRGPVITQVPFVAMCERGHIQDFPFREWVHKKLVPNCHRPIRLYATGGASLGAQTVACGCGRKRTLERITGASHLDGEPVTYLSKELSPEAEYTCRGSTPWHGTDEGEGCGYPVRGSLRAASNLYYALTRSAIYIPRQVGDVPEKLIELLEAPPLKDVLMTARQFTSNVPYSVLRNSPYSYLLVPFSDENIQTVIDLLAPEPGPAGTESIGQPDIKPLEAEEQFRREEFEVLRKQITTPELKIRKPSMGGYPTWFSSRITRVSLLDQLRETRAFWGFNRVYPDGGTVEERTRMLWKTAMRGDWLPAYVVRGEGIFIELDEEAVAFWEQHPAIIRRVSQMSARFETARRNRNLRQRSVTPRFVLVHILAHLMINRLTYDCGYSSASLRERLFVSQGPRPMAGLLVYTAAGDSEGTMGGLVRMGQPRYLDAVTLAALQGASWCSSDPVCMELAHQGQGPDSCNLAACHSCALVPETACEEFNRFLDRGLVVGTLEEPCLGYFQDVQQSTKTMLGG